MKIKALLTLPILALGFCVASSVTTALTDPADPTHTQPAYFWGGTTDGNTPSAYQGAGAFDASRVTVPSADGNVTGYAWSGHGYGWLSFESGDVASCVTDLGLPAGTNCTAKRVGDALTGFARILSIKNAGANSGGWHGYVKLDGVSIASGALTGYAWSPELGYIQFAGAVTPVPTLTLRFSDCAGSAVPSPIALTLVNKRSLPIVACDGTTDVTSSVTTWGDESGKDFAHFIADGARKRVEALAVGTEMVTAVRGSNSYAVSVDVSDPCVPNNCEATTCINTTCWDGCANVPGEDPCNPGGFKEVAP